jgi:Predicted transcriptional regulators
MEWKKRQDFESAHFSNIKKRFGRNLRIIRVTQGLTQEELSFRSGLNRNYISDTERGARNISVVAISKLADGLGVEIKELFYFERKE